MPSESEKLQKVVARAGVGSRRDVEHLIATGRVTVNGQVAHVGMRVDASDVKVAVDGVEIPVDPTRVYYLINKPLGVVTTARDPQGRRIVTDLVPAKPRVFPVGRLDRDSTGLLILTNDGDLTEHLTHPRHGVTKTYNVLVRGALSLTDLNRFTEGIELEDGLARAVSATLVDRNGPDTLVELVLTEGRNREIRRMVDTLGFSVESLFRTAIGSLRDATLKSGTWRELSPNEVRDLYKGVHA